MKNGRIIFLKEVFTVIGKYKYYFIQINENIVETYGLKLISNKYYNNIFRVEKK